MSTISENLQIIADSTAAIKQAIIDKGGTIEGDITTWAEAISGISGGSSGSSEEEIIFTGSFTDEPGGVYISGVISQTFDSIKRVIVLTHGDTSTVCNSTVLRSGSNGVTLYLTTNAPISIGPSDVTMVLTNANGGNGKIIKINL